MRYACRNPLDRVSCRIEDIIWKGVFREKFPLSKYLWFAISDVNIRVDVNMIDMIIEDFPSTDIILLEDRMLGKNLEIDLCLFPELSHDHLFMRLSCFGFSSWKTPESFLCIISEKYLSLCILDDDRTCSDQLWMELDRDGRIIHLLIRIIHRDFEVRDRRPELPRVE